MNRLEREKCSKVVCAECESLCCKLTVVLGERDAVPAHLTARLPGGLHVMAKDKDGWCVALDKLRMKCSIYPDRPITCSSFVMGGPYCRAQREEHASQSVRAIAIEII